MRNYTNKTKNSNQRWTDKDKQFIKDNANKLRDEDIARLLKRSVKSVREKRRELGVTKAFGRGRVSVVNTRIV